MDIEPPGKGLKNSCPLLRKALHNLILKMQRAVLRVYSTGMKFLHHLSSFASEFFDIPRL